MWSQNSLSILSILVSIYLSLYLSVKLKSMAKLGAYILHAAVCSVCSQLHLPSADDLIPNNDGLLLLLLSSVLKHSKLIHPKIAHLYEYWCTEVPFLLPLTFNPFFVLLLFSLMYLLLPPLFLSPFSAVFPISPCCAHTTPSCSPHCYIAITFPHFLPTLEAYCNKFWSQLALCK